MHGGAALLGHAMRGVFLGILELLDTDQLFLERLRGARVIADFIAARCERNIDIPVAVSELKQHFADTADRAANSDSAKRGHAAKHQNDEQADAEIHPANMHALQTGLRRTLFGFGQQRRRCALDLAGDRAAEFAGA